MKGFLCAAFAAALVWASSTVQAAVTWTGPVTEVDGRSPTWVQFPLRDCAIRYRPFSATEKTLTLQNYYVHDIADQKAFGIDATLLPDGNFWAYKNITIRNAKIYNVYRTGATNPNWPGPLHIDHIRIAGGAKQDVVTDVLLEHIDINGGDALPILIADGMFGTITLRDVSIRNTTLNNVQVKMDKVGFVNKIIVENSPNLSIALIGRPGSIGEVIVRNSPGARVGDTLTNTGVRSGARITFENGGGTTAPPPPVPVPEPAGLAVLGLAGLLLVRRRNSQPSN